MVDDEDTSSLKVNIAPFGKLIVKDYYNSDIKHLIEKNQE